MPRVLFVRIEVEMMEGEPFDELAAAFRLEGGQRRVAQFLIGEPVAGGDAIEQPLVELNEFAAGFVGHAGSLGNCKWTCPSLFPPGVAGRSGPTCRRAAGFTSASGRPVGVR